MATDCVEQLEKPSITKFPEGCAPDLWQTWMLSESLGLSFWCLPPAGFRGVGAFRNGDCPHCLSSQLCSGCLNIGYFSPSQSPGSTWWSQESGSSLEGSVTHTFPPPCSSPLCGYLLQCARGWRWVRLAFTFLVETNAHIHTQTRHASASGKGKHFPLICFLWVGGIYIWIIYSPNREQPIHDVVSEV